MSLEILVQKYPVLIVALGDFNVKSKKWCSNNVLNFEGTKNENITSRFALQQLITLQKKCPYSQLFCSAFSGIRTEYGEILVFSTNAGKCGSE